MVNAVLTFKEYLLDYASKETKSIGEKAIYKQLDVFKKQNPEKLRMVEEKMKLIEEGARDAYV